MTYTFQELIFSHEEIKKKKKVKYIVLSMLRTEEFLVNQ